MKINQNMKGEFLMESISSKKKPSLLIALVPFICLIVFMLVWGNSI